MVSIAPQRETPPVQRKRFTRAEYDRIAETGIWDGERIELVDEEILCMSPIGPVHNVGVALGDQACARLFRKGYHVRVQSSFVVPIETELQPDIAVVPGEARDYLHNHPDVAALIVEVAETSLEYDLTTKASLYARAGVPDYWVVNLVTPSLIVHREPIEDSAYPFGYGYSVILTYQSSEELTPLARPRVSLKVADLLP